MPTCGQRRARPRYHRAQTNQRGTEAPARWRGARRSARGWWPRQPAETGEGQTWQLRQPVPYLRQGTGATRTIRRRSSAWLSPPWQPTKGTGTAQAFPAILWAIWSTRAPEAGMPGTMSLKHPPCLPLAYSMQVLGAEVLTMRSHCGNDVVTI